VFLHIDVKGCGFDTYSGSFAREIRGIQADQGPVCIGGVICRAVTAFGCHQKKSDRGHQLTSSTLCCQKAVFFVSHGLE
jgi:hypothetical protein